MDLLLFSGGVGENGYAMRSEICSGLEFLGVGIDEQLNKSSNGQGIISKPCSKVKILVINTDEERVIARDIGFSD